MKKLIFILLLMTFSISHSQDINEFFKKVDIFFNTNVKDGNVDYDKIYKSPDDLNEIIALASTILVLEEDAKQHQAFWINAYNISVIKGIVDIYPIKSPLDDKGFFDKNKYNIGGMKVTLNTIENKILRAKYNDARFHFVLVCGAIGCPPIINKAYMPDNLEKQLEEQTTIALNGNFIKVNDKKKRIAVSEIMKWYKEDFLNLEGNEINFINKYRTQKIPENYKITYFTYNWNLNIIH